MTVTVKRAGRTVSLDQDGITWDRSGPQMVALVLLNAPVSGTTIARLCVDGQLYGCRHVNPGRGHDECVATWINTSHVPVIDVRGVS